MERTGKCLCGAVSYVAEVEATVSACHCAMCRRWAGGPFFAVSAKKIRWTGDEYIKVFTSSAWAERAFCTECGTGLFYRITADGDHHGSTTLAFGTLDDQDGFDLVREWFIDKKPGVYTIAGDRETVTESQVMAMFGG